MYLKFGSNLNSEYQELMKMRSFLQLDKDLIEDEIGDVFFTLSQLSRHLKGGS